MLQVIANTIRPGCNHQQLIDFYPNVEIALMDISIMQRQDMGKRPYVYALASELPAVADARKASLESWASVNESDVFMTAEEEQALGLN
jgi:hypothetical protein